MYEGLLKYAIPMLIVLTMINFIWALILTAIKPPGVLDDKRMPGHVDPDWKYLDAGPIGIRKSVGQEVHPSEESAQKRV